MYANYKHTQIQCFLIYNDSEVKLKQVYKMTFEEQNLTLEKSKMQLFINTASGLSKPM